MKFFIFAKWSGRACLTLLWFIIVQELGWGALWWAVPLSAGIIFGSYAERDIDHYRSMDAVKRRIQEVIEKVAATTPTHVVDDDGNLSINFESPEVRRELRKKLDAMDDIG